MFPFSRKRKEGWERQQKHISRSTYERTNKKSAPFWSDTDSFIIGGIESVILFSKIFFYALLFKIMDFFQFILSYKKFCGNNGKMWIWQRLTCEINYTLLIVEFMG